MRRPTIEGWSGWTPGRVIVAIIMVASFSVWIYAFSGKADRVPLDTLDDPSFAAAAEPICAAAHETIAAVPNAVSATDTADRAAQVREVTAVLDRMVTDLDNLYTTGAATGTERDRAVVRTWLDRWRVILGDRDDYADRIEVDGGAQFYISAEAGRRSEDSIEYVARINRMRSCVLPTDVG